MSLAGFLRRIAVCGSAPRMTVAMSRPLACTRLTRFAATTTTESMELKDICSNSNARELEIGFLITLFVKLHERNLTDVLNDALAGYSLSKKQTMALLESETFVKLEQKVVTALLHNKALVREHLSPEELWEVLKKWSMHKAANRDSNSSNPLRSVHDKDREWLEVQKSFLAFIDFNEMDASYFMKNIEPIPDSYHIMTRDHKYRIMKSHCLKLLNMEPNISNLAKNFSVSASENEVPIMHDVNEYKRLDRNETDASIARDIYGQPL